MLFRRWIYGTGLAAIAGSALALVTAEPAIAQSVPVETSLTVATRASEIDGDLNYQDYTNARFDYSVLYPAALVTPQPPPTNGDGLQFNSESGDIVMTVAGSSNALRRSLSELYQNELESEMREITYRDRGDDWFVVSGYGDGTVFYTKKMFVPSEVPGMENIVSLYLTYQQRLQPEFDRVVSRIANSLSGTAEGDRDVERVQVYFPKPPAITEVEPVVRRTGRVAEASYAIEQLIAGPTPAERERGLVGPIELTGESNCYGKDFTLEIADDGTARLQFCREFAALGGVGDTGRIRNAVTATLEQFATVNEVVILTQDGTCFADYEGDNDCLAQLEE